jgi:hypothetical protein
MWVGDNGEFGGSGDPGLTGLAEAEGRSYRRVSVEGEVTEPTRVDERRDWMRSGGGGGRRGDA